MTRKPMTWGLATLLAAVFFQLQPLLPNALAESGPTVESVYPGLATGVLQLARLTDMEKGTLLQGDGIEIQASLSSRSRFSTMPKGKRFSGTRAFMRKRTS